MSFLRELRRRNVLRVAVAYAAIAWLIIQIVETLFPVYGFSEAAVRAVVTLLAIGFVVAVVLGWVFEWTPEGFKLDSQIDPAESVAPLTGKLLDRIIMTVMTLGLAYFAIDKFVLSPGRDIEIAQEAAEQARSEAQAVSGRTSIAVLPFENLTGDAEFDYLASGLADETSASLARIELENLRIIGVVSARALADSELPAQQIGREVGIDFLVLSSLRREGSRIRVTSRLIRVADSEQMWSASFDRELTNVLGLQRELSIAIAEQIRQRLSPDVAAAIDRRQTQNPEAYRLYLKGRHEWSLLSPASIRQSLQYFEQAVTMDPGYALAWAGIAHTTITQPVTADAKTESIIATARNALDRAVRYGPDLAEAHYAKGYFHFFLDWDWPPAEAAARQAISLDPNSAIAHMFLGIVLSQVDNHVEARAMLRRARELDPLFALMFANSAVVALQADDPHAALEFSKQAIAIGPENWAGYLHLGTAHLALDDFDAALEAFSAADRFSGGNSKAVASRAYVLARIGQTVDARAVLAAMHERSAGRYVPPYAFAVVHAGLGEADAAFAWLDRALAERDVHLLGLAKDRRLSALRTDPRFVSLMRRCGFLPD